VSRHENVEREKLTVGIEKCLLCLSAKVPSVQKVPKSHFEDFEISVVLWVFEHAQSNGIIVLAPK
jgi:hypothetical protein